MARNCSKAFTATAYPPTVTEIVPNTIFHVMEYGHSNASFIIANESVILVDSLDTDARAAKAGERYCGEDRQADQNDPLHAWDIPTMSAAPVSSPDRTPR